MYILGISAFYHDSAVCLLKDGEIIFAAQEERFTRKKQDEGFPREAIKHCLEKSNLTINDIDYIAFYDKPLLKFERILESYMAFAPRGFESFIKAIPLWLKDKLWMKTIIRKELGFKGKFIFPEHHISHAASAFFPSPFKSAAFLTIDGVGEWSTTSFGKGQGNSLEIFADIHFPHSLGLLYSAFTYYTGFKVNSGEYKVMGLAPYGEPKYTKLIFDNLIDLKEDGSFRLNMDYFNFAVGLTMTSEKFHQLFGGPPRKPESLLTQKDMDLARSLQDVTEEIVLRMGKHVYQQTKETNLCMAGGVALNCVANGRLLREGPFKNIWVQPASGDAGGALGAALSAWYQVLGNERNVDGEHDVMKGAFLGNDYSDQEIEKFLKSKKIKYTKVTDATLYKQTARFLADEKVIGWFQGSMEFGPRALGARSIIGDARSAKMQEVMNLKIKFRESFRPFAPAVLKDRVGDYFDFKSESPYMLMVATVKKNRQIKMTKEQKELFGIEKLNIVRSDIPAVTHVDYSARLQTVDEQNPYFYKLIKEFDQQTGCPVIINTSFNVRGEPIVCTPEDAFRCFMRTHIDYLVLGHFIVDKKEQKALDKDTEWQKEFVLD